MKKIMGPTPSGGAYCLIYYYDEQGNEVDETQAVRSIAIEYDSNDKEINSTYFVLNTEKE